MHNISARLAAWSIRQRALVWTLLLVITGIAIIGHYDARIVTGLFDRGRIATEDKPSSNDQDRPTPPANVQPISLSRSDAVLVVESSDFFTPRGAEAMQIGRAHV